MTLTTKSNVKFTTGENTGDPKSVGKVVEQLKAFNWVDLTHSFGPESPRFPSFARPEFKTIFTHSDGFYVKQYTFPGQFGTHIDPPIHFDEHQDKYVENFSLKELVLPLVVIDNSAAAKKSPDSSLSVNDIKEWEKKHGKIPANSFVALRTDWSKRWPSQEKFENLDDKKQAHYPGWDLDALKFIYEQRGVTANGHETFDTDTAVKQEHGLVGEYYVLSHGHYQVELLDNLDLVPATGAYIFISVPKAEEAPGFPVRAFAVVPR
ncbi:cyclase family protein [Lentilactobacillus farraginis]|uniref:Cyclase family protein n=1 Tax=Lentilactobacillus farraginis DSM 18382 = JCM 14108 TaxID=1423743 RepID=X0PC74_9LACO|nr:cyclase family protein [Lentilactobacillus farraginis]KRM03287.1 cyclase family protein [Lentilactobacillus farraginis DSM 18382 = JCM 14108]GAF38049.1 metal-dependent hydrolase/cyclase [Lentilactobacillus farraginis DSM 18382 = JCM 14108]